MTGVQTCALPISDSDEEKLLQALAKVNDAPLDAVAKLPPLFADEADYGKFCCRHAQHQVEREALAAYNG